jgi:N utilization substance protein A
MASPIQARTEFASALNQVCAERGLDPEVVLDTIKSAIIAAYRKDHPEEFEHLEEDEDLNLTVEINPETGVTALFRDEEGKQVDITPPGFGRIAAQTAKQVILQRVREAEKSAIIDEYRDRVGAMITGMVLRFDGKNVIFDIGRGQGFMPPEDQIRGEFYKMNQRQAVYIKDIRATMRGETIIVSRSVPELVVELFRREVPEVNSGAVEIKAIAREAGIRTKIAVDSTQSGVDPVGSCVGQKGVRVQEVINELNNEKIDIIQYTDNPSSFIASALAPAEKLDITIDEVKRVATITVPDDQLSLAIGRGGQNVRLAAKLTGYKINIKGSKGKSLTVTGEEEFEIDQLSLPEDIRTALVEANITSIIDIERKSDILSEATILSSKDLDTLKQALEKFKLISTRQEEVKPEPSDASASVKSDESEAPQETESSDEIPESKEDSSTLQDSSESEKASEAESDQTDQKQE